jgi:hypothetical protein
MKTILIVTAILLVLPIVKQLIVFGIARLIGRAVGQAALNQQPDEIQLIEADSRAWKNAQAAAIIADPLTARGFQDAGIYRIPEMPGVIVGLMAKPEERFLAAIYEHPQVGHWMDITTLYEDGTSSTFTTSKPTGLVDRPGHPMIHAPGAGPLALYARARAERGRGRMKATPVADAAQEFERSYAESTAWRKRRGISACEVAEVAKAA